MKFAHISLGHTRNKREKHEVETGINKDGKAIRIIHKVDLHSVDLTETGFAAVLNIKKEELMPEQPWKVEAGVDRTPRSPHKPVHHITVHRWSRSLQRFIEDSNAYREYPSYDDACQYVKFLRRSFELRSYTDTYYD